MRPHKEDEVVIRQAETPDVPALTAVTQVCFTEDILWQVQRLSNRYWEIVLDSGSSETWMWLIKGEIAAFSVIIFDLSSWIKEIAKLRYSMATRLLALMTHPGLVVRKLSAWTWLPVRPQQDPPMGHASAADRFQPLETVAGLASLVSYGGIRCDPTALAWAELTAVMPAHRKRGLALDTVRFNEARARERGCAAIGGVIEGRGEREALCWIHERFHYVPVHTVRQLDGKRVTYVKILDRARSQIKTSCLGESPGREVVLVSVQ